LGRVRRGWALTGMVSSGWPGLARPAGRLAGAGSLLGRARRAAWRLWSTMPHRGAGRSHRADRAGVGLVTGTRPAPGWPGPGRRRWAGRLCPSVSTRSSSGPTRTHPSACVSCRSPMPRLSLPIGAWPPARRTRWPRGREVSAGAWLLRDLRTLHHPVDRYHQFF